MKKCGGIEPQFVELKTPRIFSDIMPKENETPLVDAAFEQDLATVGVLLKSGTSVNEQDSFGSTALNYAAMFGHFEMVRLLLAHGADASIKDSIGEDALCMAEDDGHAEVIKLLIAAGARYPET